MEEGQKRSFDASDNTVDRELGEDTAERSSREESTVKRKRVIGPSLPPSTTSGGSTEKERSESESDSDDDVGPTLPSEPTIPFESRTIDETRPPRRSVDETHSSHANESQPQRDEWMLQPPDSADWTTKVDPTKLRNRKFQSGKSVKAPAASEGSTAWTESPSEKMKRLQNQVMGINTGLDQANTARSERSVERRMQKHIDVS